MAIFRPADPFWSFLERVYQLWIDRGNLALFKTSIILLIINVLSLFTSGSFIKAQIPNDLAISGLFQKFHDFNQGKYYSILGEEYFFLKQYYQIDSTAQEALKISKPMVDYRKIGKRTFLRSIEWELAYVDTTSEKFRTFQMEQQDTLSRAQVKMSREIEERKLRGSSPFPVHKYLLPAAGTLAGFAAIISLFYVRS